MESNIKQSDAFYREKLSPAQFCVLRQHETEAPGSSALNSEKRAGIYHCAACDLPLFTSTTKYESGSGWPSFFAPIEGNIGLSTDYKIGYARTEVHCSRCESHLGHVFEDGPPPTGQRFCINGVALTFEPTEEEKQGEQDAGAQT